MAVAGSSDRGKSVVPMVMGGAGCATTRGWAIAGREATNSMLARMRYKMRERSGTGPGSFRRVIGATGAHSNTPVMFAGYSAAE
ncbi:MAG: hypothetical protein Kow0077_19030 [Anaerolineae bacterium]